MDMMTTETMDMVMTDPTTTVIVTTLQLHKT
jgi:hypothetical protein